MRALPVALAVLLAAPAVSAKEVVTLEQALAAVDKSNPDLAAARARLTAARELSRKAWSAYLPTVTATGSYVYSGNAASMQLPSGYSIRDVGIVDPNAPIYDPSQPISIENPPGEPTSLVMVPAGIMEIEIQKHHMLNGQLQVTQALLAPALWPVIQNAELAGDAAELGVQNARREILFATAQLYYGAVGLKEVVAAQARFLDMSREHERDAKVRFELGSAPEVAYLRAQIERIRAEQDARRAEIAYTSALSALAVLLDREPDFDVVHPQAVPVSSGDGKLDERLDVRSARLSLEIAERTRDGARNSYLPNLGWFFQYSIGNTKGFTGEYDAWSTGLSLVWTLWDGGLRESQTREASAAVIQGQAELRATEARARDELRRAKLDLQSAQANRVKAEEQLRLARETAEMVKTSYDLGAATYLEVVDVNTAVLAAELAVITETLNGDLAALKLAKATGEWRP